MDTDQLEHDMNELCHEWMLGKAPTDGVFGTVQAAARVFIFQALSTWTVLEATGQTEQLAPDFQAWLRSIPGERRALCAPGLQREGHDPKALSARRTTSRRPTTRPAAISS
jgi:hypothetical protein